MAEEKKKATTLDANESELTDEELETVAGGATVTGLGCGPGCPRTYTCIASVCRYGC